MAGAGAGHVDVMVSRKRWTSVAMSGQTGVDVDTT